MGQVIALKRPERFTVYAHCPGSSVILTEIDSLTGKDARTLSGSHYDGLLVARSRRTGAYFRCTRNDEEPYFVPAPNWPHVDPHERPKHEALPPRRRPADERRDSPVLGDIDAAALQWFLGPGQCAFERSWCGDMLEFIERSAYTSRRCAPCFGAGILHSGDWCPSCAGTGSIPVRRRSRGEETVAVKHQGFSVAYNPFSADTWALETYATVSRQLGRVGGVSVIHRLALEAFYGNEGERWGRTDRKRIFAVYPLTHAGQKLIRMAQKPGLDVKVSFCEILDTEANMQKLNPVVARGALLGLAGEQAHRVVAEASLVWNQVAGDDLRHQGKIYKALAS
jgi:hypothetical protein